MPMPSRGPPRGSRHLLALRGDALLVARVRAGDAAAFEALYHRHVPGILSFCRHMLGSREEAEDAVQMVFVSAHRHLVAAGREINVKPWLYTIARNRCLSMLRARREEGRGELEVSTEGLHHEVERRSDLRALVADLQDLPTDQRAALVLSELGDLSHAEVAEILECGPAQVKGLVFRARSGLVERRDARDADCQEIRVELANATGGGLRRGRLRHHVKACAPCAEFLDDMRRQRRMLGLALPVVPTLALKSSVLGALGGGGGAAGAAVTAGAGAAATAGAGAGAAATAGATIAKLAVVGALVGGAGVVAVSTDGPAQSKPQGGEAAERTPPPPSRELHSSAVGRGALGGSGPEQRLRGARGVRRAPDGAGPVPPASRVRPGNGNGRGLARGRTDHANGRSGMGRPPEPPGQVKRLVRGKPIPPGQWRNGPAAPVRREKAAPKPKKDPVPSPPEPGAIKPKALKAPAAAPGDGKPLK